VSAYACALDDTLGKGALPRLRDDAAKLMPDFNRAAKGLYDNFLGLIRGKARAAQ